MPLILPTTSTGVAIPRFSSRRLNPTPRRVSSATQASPLGSSELWNVGTSGREAAGAGAEAGVNAAGGGGASDA